jgi:hypothetical protein
MATRPGVGMGVGIRRVVGKVSAEAGAVLGQSAVRGACSGVGQGRTAVSRWRGLRSRSASAGPTPSQLLGACPRRVAGEFAPRQVGEVKGGVESRRVGQATRAGEMQASVAP